MKLKNLYVSSQVLILGLSMLQVANAQTQDVDQQNAQYKGQVLQTNMPQKSWTDSLKRDLSLNYYTQFLGPTLSGPGGGTYNVFVESNTPYQNFHSANLRYQINPKWSVGTSLAAITAYGDTTTTKTNNQFRGLQGQTERFDFFNARLFVGIPSLDLKIASLSTVVSYEAPTSVDSRNAGMKYGGVLSQVLNFKLPSLKFTSGVSWQYYRVFYDESVIPARTDVTPSGTFNYSSIAKQATIFNIGPFFAYRFNDRWSASSSVTFDWDQRGKQAGTGTWNNNLPDRARGAISYYPKKIKQITNVGVFTQSLLNYSQDTQVFGAEIAARF